MRDILNDLDTGVPEKPCWDVVGPRPRSTRNKPSYRRPTQRAASATEAALDLEDAGGSWEAYQHWGDDVGSGADGGMPPPQVPPGSSSGFPQQAARIPSHMASVRTAEEQQSWDSVRPHLQRSYVQHLPGMREHNAELVAAQRHCMQQRLAAQLPSCSCCGSTEMEPAGSVSVMVIQTEVRFELSVPVSRCSQSGCNGTFVPSSFSVGCFPATPKTSVDVSLSSTAQPARWISLRLLQLGDSLIFQGRRPAAVYALATAVHQQHALNGCSDPPLGWEHFKRQLAGALMEYGYLMCMLMVLVNLGVQGIPTGPLSGCPCCAGARHENSAPDVHVNIDFCYGLSHLARCGTSAPKQPPPNQQLFLCKEDVAALVQEEANSSAATTEQADAERSCSDFDAARVAGRTSDKCDVTAVGATMCRHSIVAHLMDINTGERYIYAALMLCALMVTHSIAILVVWYDINCKFSGWFKRWSQSYQAVLDALRRFPSSPSFPLPCFHRFSHSAACQEQNDGRYMHGVGRQYSEPCETLWANVAPQGVTTQYLTHQKRWGRLERAVQLYNEQQAARIVQLLCCMHAAAQQALALAAERQGHVLQQLRGYYGIHQDQALALLVERAETIQQRGRPSIEPTPQAQYARLRLQRLFSTPQPLPAAALRLPAMVDVFGEGEFEKLSSSGSSALARLETRLRQLCNQLYAGAEPALDSPEFAAAVAALALSEIERLELALQHMAQQHQLMDQLITSLYGRPGEQRKTRTAKQRMKQRMRPLLNSLLRWLGGGYVGFQSLPAAQQYAAVAANAAAWSVDLICSGAYPWESSSSGTPAASAMLPAVATREELVTQLRTHANEVARATEELQLLARERQRCLAFLQQQHGAIAAALDGVQRRAAALQSGADVPPCSSFAACQPASDGERQREQMYCSGLALLLTQRLQAAAAQLQAAHQAFTDGSSSNNNHSTVDLYESDDDEGMAM